MSTSVTATLPEELHTKSKRGRKKLGEEYDAVKQIAVNLPRVMMEAVDLRAQYDRTSRQETFRSMLWTAIRLSASTDRRYAELLKNNSIDVSPVNLKPNKDIYSDGINPTDLV